jgi:hypothetical protein
MTWHSLRSRVLGGLARWLGRWADFLHRQAGFWAAVAQRSRRAAAESGEPPAHWLARLEQADVPLQWMEGRAPSAPQYPARPLERPAWPSGPERSDVSPPDIRPDRDGSREQKRGTTGDVIPRRDEPPSARAPSRMTRSPQTGPPKRLIPPRPAQGTGVGAVGEEARPRRDRSRPQPPPSGEAEAPARRTPTAEAPAASEGAPSVRTGGTSSYGPTRRTADTAPPPSRPEPRSRPAGPRTPTAGPAPVPEPSERAPDDDEMPPPGPKGRKPWGPPAFEPEPPRPAVRAYPTRGVTERTEVDSGAPGSAPQAPRQSAPAAFPERSRADPRPSVPAPASPQDEEARTDRWPSLPEPAFPLADVEDARIAEEWEAQRRRWERTRRLAEEQRGDPWSALPF